MNLGNGNVVLHAVKRFTQDGTEQVTQSATVAKIALSLLIVLLAAFPAQGATWYYWDTSGNTASLGGSGNWIMPGAWLASPSGPSVNWSDGNDAVFSGTPGTVTLSQAVTLGWSGDLTYALQVQSTGYVISGGTINLQGAGGNASARRRQRCQRSGDVRGRIAGDQQRFQFADHVSLAARQRLAADHLRQHLQIGRRAAIAHWHQPVSERRQYLSDRRFHGCRQQYGGDHSAE